MLAEQIGAAIAAQGWAVMTGGYGGLMEVTSRAAAQAGGTVIGLPMHGWTGLTPNPWNHELRWSDTYPERLAHLLAADALIALDGGLGTLSEAPAAWCALQTDPAAAADLRAGGFRRSCRTLRTTSSSTSGSRVRINLLTRPGHAHITKTARQPRARAAARLAQRKRTARRRGWAGPLSLHHGTLRHRSTHRHHRVAARAR